MSRPLSVHRKSASAQASTSEMVKRKRSSGVGILVPDSVPSTRHVSFSTTSPVKSVYVKMKPDAQRQRLQSKLVTQTQYQGLAQFDDIFAQLKRAEDEAQFKDALKSVMDFVVQPEKVGLMSDAQIRDLFKWLSQIIFHEIEDPPDSVVYSDVPAVYSCGVFTFLHLIHQIITSLILRMKPQIQKELVSASFVRRFILMLRSPSSEEQGSLVVVIHKIFESIPTQRDLIFRSMARLIMGYTEGLFSYFCVSPVLEFFIMHFRKRSLISTSSMQLFKLCIFPLFATPFVHMFYRPLAILSEIFHKDNPDVGFWCLSYLFLHWPKSCANKEALFLHHLRSICESIKAETNEGRALTLFRRVACSIESLNFKVSKAAIELVVDHRFIAAYGAMRSLMLPIILPALQNAAKHWAPEVREAATDAMNTFYVFDSRSAHILTSKDIRVEHLERTRQGWEIIAAAIGRDVETLFVK